METIKFDFARKAGSIKPLHGVNNAPYTFQDQEFVTKAFADAGIPFCRLHDTEYPYGGTYFVDIPNIFPNFDADPENPESYDFHLTDEFITCVIKAGTKIVYRLGVSIEWASKKYRIIPPKDYKKWAKICEMLVRHYNEGWANGFNYNIEYWEIWNEPENPPMWTGTKEEYFELYAVTSKHLKAFFPNLKIGGYGSCGFYGITRDNLDDFHNSFVGYFDDFLKYITSNEINAPLDFFSWHIYTRSIEEMTQHAKYARKKLDEYGFSKTETSLNEWNYGPEGKGFPHIRDMVGATFIAGALCSMQNSGVVDSAMYYAANLLTPYNGFFDFLSKEYQKPYYVFIAFNELYKLKNQVHSQWEIDKVYSCASANDKEGVILISNYSDEDLKVELVLEGIMRVAEVCAEFYVLDENSNMELTRSEIFRGDVIKPVIKLNAKTAYMIKLLSD